MAGSLVTIVKYDRADPRLGRHVEHDEASRAFAFAAAAKPPTDTIIWEDDAPVLNQGDIGGCVGWTGADILNTAMYKPVRDRVKGGQFFDDTDGKNFYHLSTVADNIAGTYPPDDTGSSGLGLAKALKKLGYIDRYTHVFSWNSYLTAIAKQPVAVGTLWTNDMFKPDKNGVVRVGTLTDANIAGGHEYSIRGRDNTRGLNLCRNHWTATWDTKKDGPKVPGEFWLPDQDLQLLLKNQGDITVLHGVGMP
jgi:hypothetical protein